MSGDRQPLTEFSHGDNRGLPSGTKVGEASTHSKKINFKGEIPTVTIIRDGTAEAEEAVMDAMIARLEEETKDLSQKAKQKKGEKMNRQPTPMRASFVPLPSEDESLYPGGFCSNCAEKGLNKVEVGTVFLHTNFQGSPPDVLKITSIDLSKNRLTTTNDLIEYQNLRKLNLSHNSIAAPSQLPVSLSILDISHNSLVRLFGLQYLENLSDLNASFNRIEEISGLSSNLKLKVLRLQGNLIKTVKGLATNRSLEHLDLSSNQISKVEDVRPLSLNTKLKVLNVYGNDLAKSSSYRIICRNLVPSLAIIDDEHVTMTASKVKARAHSFSPTRHRIVPAAKSTLNAATPSNHATSVVKVGLKKTRPSSGKKKKVAVSKQRKAEEELRTRHEFLELERQCLDLAKATVTQEEKMAMANKALATSMDQMKGLRDRTMLATSQKSFAENQVKMMEQHLARKDSDNQSLREEIQMLKEENAQLKVHKEGLFNDMMTTQQDVMELKEAVHTSVLEHQKERSELEASVAFMADQLAAGELEIEGLQAVIQRLGDDLGQSKAESAAVRAKQESEHEFMEKEILCLQCTVSKLGEEKLAAVENYEKTLQAKELVEIRLMEAESTVIQMKKMKEEMGNQYSDDLTTASKMRREIESENKTLKARLDSLSNVEEDVKKLRQAKTEESQKVSIFESQVDDLKSKVVELETEIECLHKKLQTANEAVQDKSKSLAAIENFAETVSAERQTAVHTLSAEKTKMTNEIESLRKALANEKALRDHDIESLRRTSEHQMAEIEDQKVVMETELALLRKTVEDKDETIATLREAKSEYESQCLKLKREIEAAEADKTRLSSEVNRIQNVFDDALVRKNVNLPGLKESRETTRKPTSSKPVSGAGSGVDHVTANLSGIEVSEQVNILVAELTSTREKLIAVEDELRVARRETNQERDRMSAKMVEMERMKVQSEEQSAKLQKHKEEIQHLQATETRLRGLLDSVNESLDVARKENRDWQERVNQALSSKEGTLREWESEKERRTTENQSLKETISRLKLEKETSVQEATSAAHARIQSLTAERERLRKELKKRDKEWELVGGQLKMLKSRKDSKDQSSSAADQTQTSEMDVTEDPVEEVQSMRDRVISLSSSKAKLEQKVKDLKTRLTASKTETKSKTVMKLELQNKQLQSRLQQVAREKEFMKSEVDRLIDTAAERESGSHNNCPRLEVKVRHLQRMLERSEAERDVLREELQKLEEKLGKATAEKGALQVRIAKLSTHGGETGGGEWSWDSSPKEENVKLRFKVERLTEKVASYKAKADRLRSRVEEVEMEKREMASFLEEGKRALERLQSVSQPLSL